MHEWRCTVGSKFSATIGQSLAAISEDRTVAWDDQFWLQRFNQIIGFCNIFKTDATQKLRKNDAQTLLPSCIRRNQYAKVRLKKNKGVIVMAWGRKNLPFGVANLQ